MDTLTTPSESNCFLLETKRPGKEVIDAMAAQNVFIGRIWPIMPTCVRITVGTHDEMQKFQSALQKSDARHDGLLAAAGSSGWWCAAQPDGLAVVRIFGL